MTPVVELRGLAKTYRVGPLTVPVLTAISLVMRAGEFVAVSGASGSGKSTWLNVLGLLDHADAGSYRLDGREVLGADDDERTLLRNRKLGFIFQQPRLFPRLTVEENVAVPLQYRGASKATIRDTVGPMLARLGLGALATRLPSQLSGGQLQRMAIARALVGQPRLILADEPTASLDEDNAESVMSLLLEMNREANAAMILITHLPAAAAQANRHFRLQDGMLHLVHEKPLVEMHA